MSRKHSAPTDVATSFGAQPLDEFALGGRRYEVIAARCSHYRIGVKANASAMYNDGARGAPLDRQATLGWLTDQTVRKPRQASETRRRHLRGRSGVSSWPAMILLTCLVLRRSF